ncbi:MAG: ABC transporter permease [Dehalococcoidia bacterium]
MARIALRRLLETVPLLLAVSVVIFALQEAAPVDPAWRALAVGGAADAIDERDVARKRLELGLDRPVVERYARWVVDAARLDLGESFVSKKPVAELIRERLAASLALAGAALAIGAGLAIPLGVLAAVRHRTWVDAGVRIVTLLGTSVPTFWLGFVAIWLFAVELGWLPSLGSMTPAGIVLPAAVLGVHATGLLARLTRAAMIEALHQDYVRTARAKGLRGRAIVLRHAFPNAAIPLLTALGLELAGLIGHAAVTEVVFAWPGLGRLGVEAAVAGDVPVVIGFTLTVAAFVIAINLVVDLAYLVVDPRQRALT